MGIFNFFSKKENKEDLNKGLEKTKEGVFSKLARAVAGKSKVDDEVLDNLEEVLITSDVGVDTTLRIIERIEKRVAEDKYMNTAELNGILRSEITALLEENRLEGEQGFDYGKKDGMPYVVMVVGVNGAGKTTTIGKLASKLRQAGQKVYIGAADTFRAAAIDQLAVWAERAGATMIRQDMGSDPASVAFDTLRSAVANGADVVLIDTAGRLHNKIGLMNELTKIRNVMAKVIPGAPHDVMLVLDRFDGPERFRAGQAVHPSDAGHLARHHEARRYGQGRRRDRHQRPVQDTRPFHRRGRRDRPVAGFRPQGVRRQFVWKVATRFRRTLGREYFRSETDRRRGMPVGRPATVRSGKKLSPEASPAVVRQSYRHPESAPPP